MFSKQVDNIVGKENIAGYEQITVGQEEIAH